MCCTRWRTDVADEWCCLVRCIADLRADFRNVSRASDFWRVRSAADINGQRERTGTGNGAKAHLMTLHFFAGMPVLGCMMLQFGLLGMLFTTTTTTTREYDSRGSFLCVCAFLASVEMSLHVGRGCSEKASSSLLSDCVARQRDVLLDAARYLQQTHICQ